MKKGKRGSEIIFIPEDQEERDLLASVVLHYIPERYSTLAEGPAIVGEKGMDHMDIEWPDHIKFGLMMSRARMSGLYEADSIDVLGLMGLYFRAYVTTDPERRIDIQLFVEDNDEKHLQAICEFVSKHGPKRAHAWTLNEAANVLPCPFMFYVAEALDEDPKQRMEWLVI